MAEILFQKQTSRDIHVLKLSAIIRSQNVWLKSSVPAICIHLRMALTVVYQLRRNVANQLMPYVRNKFLLHTIIYLLLGKGGENGFSLRIAEIGKCHLAVPQRRSCHYTWIALFTPFWNVIQFEQTLTCIFRSNYSHLSDLPWSARLTEHKLLDINLFNTFLHIWTYEYWPALDNKTTKIAKTLVIWPCTVLIDQLNKPLTEMACKIFINIYAYSGHGLKNSVYFALKRSRTQNSKCHKCRRLLQEIRRCWSHFIFADG